MNKLPPAWTASPAPPTLVVVGKERIQVLGTNVSTAEELVRLLFEQKIERIDLQVESSIDYERVGKVIYSVARSGVLIA